MTPSVFHHVISLCFPSPRPLQFQPLLSVTDSLSVYVNPVLFQFVFPLTLWRDFGFFFPGTVFTSIPPLNFPNRSLPQYLSQVSPPFCMAFCSFFSHTPLPLGNFFFLKVVGLAVFFVFFSPLLCRFPLIVFFFASFCGAHFPLMPGCCSFPVV